MPTPALQALAAVALLAAVPPAGARAGEGAHCHEGAAAPAAPSTASTASARRTPASPAPVGVGRRALPAVTLLDQEGRSARLADILHPGPDTVLNFIFTTCTTICPVMSASFTGLQRRLGEEAEHVRMVSISIDPEHDRPEQLRAYAKRFGAGRQWSFYTGTADDIRAVLAAFDAESADKTSHRPLTFVRRAGRADWTRIDGLVGAGRLEAELSERPRQASR